jgi:hypothetical protein
MGKERALDLCEPNDVKLNTQLTSLEKLGTRDVCKEGAEDDSLAVTKEQQTTKDS